MHFLLNVLHWVQLLEENDIVHCWNRRLFEFSLVHESICNKTYQNIRVEKICDLSLARAILIFVSRNLPKFCYLALYHLKVEIGMDWRNYSALEVDLTRVYAGKFGQILLKRVDSWVFGKIDLRITRVDRGGILEPHEIYVNSWSKLLVVN